MFPDSMVLAQDPPSDAGSSPSRTASKRLHSQLFPGFLYGRDRPLDERKDDARGPFGQCPPWNDLQCVDGRALESCLLAAAGRGDS